MSFCNVKHWALDLGLHLSMCQTSSPQRHSNTSLPLWVKNGKPFYDQLDYLTSPLSAKLQERNLTYEWEKLTQTYLCESPFDPRGRFYFRLTNPNTFSPSKCDIRDVNKELGVNMAIATTICNASSNWLTLHNCDSSLFKLVPYWPAWRKA